MRPGLRLSSGGGRRDYGAHGRGAKTSVGPGRAIYHDHHDANRPYRGFSNYSRSVCVPPGAFCQHDGARAKCPAQRERDLGPPARFLLVECVRRRSRARARALPVSSRLTRTARTVGQRAWTDKYVPEYVTSNPVRVARSRPRGIPRDYERHGLAVSLALTSRQWTRSRSLYPSHAVHRRPHRVDCRRVFDGPRVPPPARRGRRGRGRRR